MYGIFTNIYPKNHPNVGKYTIHGAYGKQKQKTSNDDQWRWGCGESFPNIQIMPMSYLNSGQWINVNHWLINPKRLLKSGRYHKKVAHHDYWGNTTLIKPWFINPRLTLGILPYNAHVCPCDIMTIGNYWVHTTLINKPCSYGPSPAISTNKSPHV